MRPFSLAIAVLPVLACGSATSPNPATLAGFDFNETAAVQPADVPYDSVRTFAGQVQVERRIAGSLCASTLEAIVVAKGAELALRVSQNPIVSCSAGRNLVTWRGTVALPSGTWHLRVTEFSGATPAGAVVIDRSVTVPAR